MSDNWVVQNLENALETWNEKLSEIWTLITTTPQNFKGCTLTGISGRLSLTSMVRFRLSGLPYLYCFL